MTSTVKPRHSTSKPSYPPRFRDSTALMLLGGLILTFAIYWPGLSGGFLFDDQSFIVGNTMIQVTRLRLGDWVSAALSFPANHQGRWLTMLSFAANHYLSGLNPFWMKLTNLGVHLTNGVLLVLVLRALFALRQRVAPWTAGTTDTFVVAVLVAVLWLILPINLTAVLYVSQRLESLSTLFVLLGLWLYLRARQNRYDGGHGFGLWISIAACGGIGVLAKESAALLPLYALCVECCITRGRRSDGSADKVVLALFCAVVAMPLIAGLLWLHGWIASADSYSRPFTIGERLLTESRVLVDYIRWTLAPSSSELSMYHDDYVLSRDLLSSPSPLPAIMALGSLVALAVAWRRKHPLFTLGIAWFFSAHLLTATVIPLELVFEHRNYFASIGLLLAVAALVTWEPGLPKPWMTRGLALAALLLFAGTTWHRAQEWADPNRLALAEALRKPHSLRAQGGLASTLLSIAMYTSNPARQSSIAGQAFAILEKMAKDPASGIEPYQSLILYHNAAHQAVAPAWWSALIARLRERAPSESDQVALRALLTCQLGNRCAAQTEELNEAFSAALSHPNARAPLLAAYGVFAADRLHDNSLAERVLRDAISREPNDPYYRANLVRVLLRQGKTAVARSERETISRLNHFGSLDDMLNSLDKLFGEADPDSLRSSRPAV